MDPAVLALIILLFIVILYVTEIIPLAVTSIGGCIAMTIFGVAEFGEAFSGFSNNVVFLIGGMMVVGMALFETGAAGAVGKRIAAVTSSEKRVLIMIMLVVGILSGFLNNSSTTAMFIPIVTGIALSSKEKISSKRMLLPLAFAANAGGMLTLVGSPPTVIVQGVLTQSDYEPLGFFEFALIGLPVFIVVMVYMTTLGYKMTGKLVKTTNNETISRAKNDQDGQGLPGKNNKMFLSLAVMGICVILFATELIPTGLTGMLGAFLVLATGCVNEKKLFRNFDWTTIFILAGSLGIARSLEVSGAGELIANTVLGSGFSDNPYFVFGAVLAIGAGLTQIMSNTATAAMLAPIALYISQGMGVSPYPMLMGICTLAAAAFATPVATPPNTMVLSGGYSFRDYLRIGGILNIIVFVLVFLLVPLIWPF